VLDLYTKIDLLVLALPLLLSFDRKVAFWKKWPQVFAAIGAVLVVFGAWDSFMAAQGVWAFNPEHAGPWRFLHLPLGEWLFFACVPYACLFVLACVRAYFPERTWRIPSPPIYALAGLFLGASWIFRARFYTGSVFLSAALALVAMDTWAPATLRARHFWVALGLTYLPFLVANGVLTGLPIVLYDDLENLAIRVGTIPIEDFFFSFSLLALTVLVYDVVGRRRGAV
jgi:lycopene cyclase domain-containing protein